MCETPHLHETLQRQYGGQALIEGVMIRGAKHVSVACRRAPVAEGRQGYDQGTGSDAGSDDPCFFVETEPISTFAGRLGQRFAFARWPFIRGTLVLLESMELGSKGLRLSANVAVESTTKAGRSSSTVDPASTAAGDDAGSPGPEASAAGVPLVIGVGDAAPAKGRRGTAVPVSMGLFVFLAASVALQYWLSTGNHWQIPAALAGAVALFAVLFMLVRREEARAGAPSTLSGIAVGATMVLGLAMGIGIFFLIPSLIAEVFNPLLHRAWALNLVEGAIRVLLFFGYLKLISRMPNIRRIFQYHGAEHQVIHVHEAGLELVPENAARFSTIHPRCGTAFLAIVLVISVVVFTFTGWQIWWQRLLLRLVGLPLIAGISYELLKWNSRHPNRVLQALVAPGLWFQRITTLPPSRDQVEVAIAAMNGVLEAERAAPAGSA